MYIHVSYSRINTSAPSKRNGIPEFELVSGPHESKAHLYIHNPWLHQWNKRNLSTSLIFPHFPIYPYVGPTIISHLYVIEILRKKTTEQNNPNFHAVRPSLPCLGMKMEMPNIPKPWENELIFSFPPLHISCWTVYIKLLGW